MAGTRAICANQPIRSPLSEAEIGEGRIYFLKPSGQSYDCKISEVFTGEEQERLKESRLIIVPLPDKLKPSSLKERSEKKEDIKDGIPIDAQDIPYDPAKPDDHVTGNPPSRRNTGGSRRSTKEPHCIPFYELPPRYVEILKSICPHCCLLGNILWRNVQQVQSRYESRFRPWKSKDETRACFLQFHTMQAPVLADWELTLALVHHLCISNDPSDSEINAPFDVEHQNEQIFAFLYVKHKDWETAEVIEQHLLPSMQLFQEEHPEYVKDPEYANRSSQYRGVDPAGGSIGLTPMLFMGVLLKWYGFKAAHVVVNSFEELINIDSVLLKGGEIVWYSDIKTKAEECNRLNARLAERNRALIGLRSRVNYVADTARNMITDACTMKKFVTDELNRGEYDAIHSRESLERALGLLDSSRFVMRDNDKFDLIARAMQQYCVDIKSLKTHMTINIGLVANHYSQLLAEAATRDSWMVLVLTVIGVVLLPFTFAAVLLTGPMFDFTASTTNWITVSRKLAWKIWGAISGIVYFAFILIFLGILIYQHFQTEKEKRMRKQIEDRRKAESQSSTMGQVQSEMADGKTNPPRPHVTNGSPV